MRNLEKLALIGAVLVTSQTAQAQFAKPEDAIKYRQSALFVMQQNFARLAGMAQGRIPFDAKQAADSAATAEFASKLPWVAFGDGTDKGGNTKAKAEIWKDKARFQDYAEKMQAELIKVNAAAKTGNLDAIKAAIGPAGGTCKTCHDAFRE